MAMKLPTAPTQAPSRGLPFTSGSLSTAALRILASPLGESASPSISGTSLERSRMRPLSSMIPGFSRPSGPKRTSFMAHSLPMKLGGDPGSTRDHASDLGLGQAKAGIGRRTRPFVRSVSIEHSAGWVTVAIRQRAPTIFKKCTVYSALTFAISVLRGQDYHMHLVRAPSCKRRGGRGRQHRQVYAARVDLAAHGEPAPRGFARTF